MLIFGLDSSAKAASCAVYDTSIQKITASGIINAEITHSETLLPLADSVLKAAKLNLTDIDAFAVTNGPGSFTGIRIAVSAVKGMAFALNKPVYPVSTLHGLAYNLTGGNCLACCVMDARRNQVYNALFSVNGKNIERLTPDRAISISDLEKELNGREFVLAGDGAKLVKKAIGGVIAPPLQREQNAASVCFAALEYTAVSAGELIPRYLRLSQAEREMKKHPKIN